MRNLKRTLSLALAAVMLMGMMVVGASAASKDFTDASDIKNVEAVDVMVALGVLEGGDKGDFQPNSILTREQAAKIICYLLLGEESAEKLTTNSAVFNDVAADRWSAPYIGYCVNLGILAGDGNGNFFPEGKLTGAAFGKMLLVALGYDPTIEKYTGNDWMINVAADAIEAGISPKGLVLSNDLSRQDAAQMAFLTLQADMVKYASKGTTVIGSDGMQVIVGNTPAEPVSDSANVNYNGADNGTHDQMYQQFCEKYFADLKKDSTNNTDAFGRPGYTWVYDGEDICFAAESASFTYTAETKASVISKDLKNYEVGGNKVQSDIAAGASVSGMVYTNGDTAAALTVAANDAPADAIAALTENGRTVEVFTDDKDVTAIVVVDTYLALVDKVDENKDDSDLVDVDFKVYVSNSTGTTYSLDEQDAFAFDEDDYVLVTIANGEIQTVSAPETVEGVAATQANTYYTIDGTKYSLSYMNKLTGAAGDYDGTYTFYLDNYGYVIGATVIEAGEGTANYAYLKAIDVTLADAFNDGAVKAKLTFLDGTTQVVNLAMKQEKGTDDWQVYSPVADAWVDIDTNGAAAGGEITIASAFYSYTVNSDNEYTLKPLGNYATAVTYNTPANVTAAVVSGWAANSSSKMVMIDGQATYTGYKNFPTTDDITAIVGAEALILHSKDSKTIKTIYVLDEASTTEAVTYAYSTSASKAYTQAGDDYYEFYVDGEVVYYQLQGTVKANTIYSLDVEDGVATPTEIVSGSTEYDTGITYTIATAQTVKEVSGEDYFTVGSTIFYMGYDKDDVACGVYDLGDDGAATTLSEDDSVTILYITVDGNNYALAVYVAE